MEEEKTWATRILEAEKRGYFSNDDRDEAIRWNRCAVGERLSFKTSGTAHRDAMMAIEKEEAMWPFYEHGMYFMDAVETDDIPRARKEYRAIQRLVLNTARREIVARAKEQ